MTTSSFLFSFYFVCGVLIFVFAVMILRHAVRNIVNWATALVLFFAGFGPILGAMGVLLERNPREGTYLFENLVASFDYIWEFFFPALVLFALVHPQRHRLWKYIRKYAFILFLPHIFHLILVIFLFDRFDPDKMINSIAELPISVGVIKDFLQQTSKMVNVFMNLLLKAHTQLFSLVNITYAGFSLFILGRSLKLDITPRVRRLTRVVITGLGLCIFTYSFARVVPIFMGMDLPQELATILINASLIIGGSSIAYVIVRYQFLDMRLIARRGILYVAAAAIFASIYILTIRQITGFFYQFSGARVEILETGFIILFIIAFQPIISRLEEWTDKILVREERNPRLRIRDLSVELLSIIELEDIKESMCTVLQEVFGAEEVELVLAQEILSEREKDPEAERIIRVLSLVGEPIEQVDFLDAMGFTVSKGGLLPGRGRRVSNATIEALPPVISRFARFKLIVPVMHEYKTMALLLLGHRRAHDRYTAEELALLSMLVTQIAAALSKIDLLKEVVEKKVMEEELNIARAIQLNLLPSAPPVLEHYEVSALSLASKQVGGDYYDYLQRDSLLSVAVADVSGKGVPASLLMASLQASLRSNMDRMEDPVVVVGKLNGSMYETTAPDKFVTLFYGCLNMKKNTFHYTNAGHLFPVVVREGGTVEVLEYSGLILGVVPTFTYEYREFKFKPGDTLVVITDGVTEAENGSGELFGEERLYNLLSTLRGQSAFEVKEAIVESVRNFSYPKGASDDLTILVLKRKE